MRNDHEPLMSYDGDCWVLNCLCGRHLGSHETAADAADAFDDHTAAALAQ